MPVQDTGIYPTLTEPSISLLIKLLPTWTVSSDPRNIFSVLFIVVQFHNWLEWTECMIFCWSWAAPVPVPGRINLSNMSQNRLIAILFQILPTLGYYIFYNNNTIHTEKYNMVCLFFISLTWYLICLGKLSYIWYS